MLNISAGFGYAAIPMVIHNTLDASATIAAAVTSKCTYSIVSSHLQLLSYPLQARQEKITRTKAAWLR